MPRGKFWAESTEQPNCRNFCEKLLDQSVFGKISRVCGQNPGGGVLDKTLLRALKKR